MNLEQVKERVCSVLRAELPNATIRISQLSENAGDFGVSVFGVERESVRLAKDIILNLDCEIFECTEFSLTPMVRDMETTRKYYPQFIPVWTSTMTTDACATELLPIALVETIDSNHAEWTETDDSGYYAVIAEEELALAA